MKNDKSNDDFETKTEAENILGAVFDKFGPKEPVDILEESKPFKKEKAAPAAPLVETDEIKAIVDELVQVKGKAANHDKTDVQRKDQRVENFVLQGKLLEKLCEKYSAQGKKHGTNDTEIENAYKEKIKSVGYKERMALMYRNLAWFSEEKVHAPIWKGARQKHVAATVLMRYAENLKGGRPHDYKKPSKAADYKSCFFSAKVSLQYKALSKDFDCAKFEKDILEFMKAYK